MRSEATDADRTEWEREERQLTMALTAELCYVENVFVSLQAEARPQEHSVKSGKPCHAGLELGMDRARP